jgi:hypothetical protein
VELARTLDAEDRDVGPLANDPPEMKPLALTLQLSRAFMLERAQAFNLVWIDSGRRPDGDGDMKQQDLTPYKRRSKQVSAGAERRQPLVELVNLPKQGSRRSAHVGKLLRIPTPIAGSDRSAGCHP